MTRLNALQRTIFQVLILSMMQRATQGLRPSHFNDGQGLPTPPSKNFDSYSSMNSVPTNDSGALPMENESVEERLASWRAQQQYKYEHQSPLEAANPRDDDGRMKLLASVSKGSISLFFFILMWRSVHHFELADQSFKGTLRLFMVFPPVVLFLGNMIACVASVMSSSNSSRNAKKRMKAVLNLNKVMELSLICYNILRLLAFPSKYVVREIYVGRTLTNFLFVIQCQLFTKVTWGAAQMNSNNFVGIDEPYTQQQTVQNNNYGGGFQNQIYPESNQQQPYSQQRGMNYGSDPQQMHDNHGTSNRDNQW